ncbi:hypothetical protein ACHAWO_001249 [Cyclotella atomus]|uniref:Uncharacterized protein n=1 Tax=Cyclotella atomus TaxID=382360 RepID=A0ABD3P906_9STRA
MSPGISLLRRSLRSNANQDRGSDYESKPSTNASTVSSLTCSVMGTRNVVGEIDIVKRSISLDRTLDTEVESVGDLKDSLGSSGSNVLPVRRLSSSGSRSSRNNKTKDFISRKLSIQDDVMKEEGRDIDTSTSSVSSITLESDIRLYHKTKSKSFHDMRSVPSVNRSRSMCRNRRMSSASAGASHSLERIREESSRFTTNTLASSCSQFPENEPERTELESGSSGSKSTTDHRSIQVERERPSNRFMRNRSHDDSTSEHSSSCRSDLDLSQHKKQQLRRIASRGDQSTASTESFVSTETLELISSLHEARIENESTIERLQHELSELACERDAFRTNSDKVVRVLTAQQTELEAQLKKERKGFADVSSLHKKELKNWMDRAALLSTKVLDLEDNAKKREVDDESRAEKILNLERNMAKLFELYSAQNSNSFGEAGHDDKDMEEVKKSLCAIDTASFEAQELNDKYTQLQKSYDELLETNRRQCEDLQSQLKQSQASLEKLREENTLLKASNDDSNGCNDELLNKICDLVDENAELMERCQELDILKEENEVLQESLMESKTKLDAAQKAADDLKSKNADLEDELELERNACEYLRQESQISSENDCLDDLREENERLTIELEEKNEAMQLLKADHQSIKETVVKLRMENLHLRDEKEEVAKTSKLIRPLPPPHPNSVSLKEKADLEARLEKLEKENKSLTESNAALSTKLSGEIERTKSLETANKGLAARICKLVDFIKEQGNSK